MGKNLFNEIVKRCDVKLVRPISMSSKRGSGGSTDGNVTLESSFSFDLSEARDELRVVYDYKLFQEVDDPGFRKEDRFEANIDYELTYEFSPALTEEHEQELEAFVEHNAKFNSWGFLRAYLARTSAEFGLPTVTLPLLKPNTTTPKTSETTDEGFVGGTADLE